ncbi:MAG: hypothetical protein Q7S00_06545, partial [bacterium]|nr:hypothetical protein [bacterium]
MALEMIGKFTAQLPQQLEALPPQDRRHTVEDKIAEHVNAVMNSGTEIIWNHEGEGFKKIACLLCIDRISGPIIKAWANFTARQNYLNPLQTEKIAQILVALLCHDQAEKEATALFAEIPPGERARLYWLASNFFRNSERESGRTGLVFTLDRAYTKAAGELVVNPTSQSKLVRLREGKEEPISTAYKRFLVTLTQGFYHNQALEEAEAFFAQTDPDGAGKMMEARKREGVEWKFQSHYRSGRLEQAFYTLTPWNFVDPITLFLRQGISLVGFFREYARVFSRLAFSETHPFFTLPQEEKPVRQLAADILHYERASEVFA